MANEDIEKKNMSAGDYVHGATDTGPTLDEKPVLTVEHLSEEDKQAEYEYLRDMDDIPEIPDDVAEQFRDVFEAYKKYLIKETGNNEEYEVACDLVQRAFFFAYKAHRNQKRRTGEMYIIHPIATAEILVELKFDPETIAAAFLHDTIEDTVVDLALVVELFGQNVGLLVNGLTKINQLVFASKEDEQALNARKMLAAIAKDARVIFVKLADRLHNMRTMKHQTPEKQKEKARETLDIYVPFCERFGIYRIKWELEDLCLMYLDRDAYYELVGLVSAKRAEREEYLADVVSELSEKISTFGIKDATIEGRPKHFYSIYKKMKEKHKTIDEIYDLFACRIIVDTITDCYSVLGIVHETYQHVPGRFKDYIAMPKDNKYQSIHTTVIGKDGISFEVQIRTKAMNATAESGVAAHWHYKEAGGSKTFVKDDFDMQLDWIKIMLENQGDSKEFMDSMRFDIAPKEVFVYSPKGDVIHLPVGSCPIDYAYNIHSGVGNHMHGAKVNGRIVPLSYQLKDGDHVEILTSDKIHGPSRDWAKMVRTQSARSKINAWFKKESRGENITTGKEILDREIQRNGFTPTQILLYRSIEELLRKYSLSSLEDLYASLGYGALSVAKVFGKLRDEYIKTLPEDKRMELGYRVNAVGQVIYRPNPEELPVDIGKGMQIKYPKNASAQNKPQVSAPSAAKSAKSNSKESSKSGVIVEGLSNLSTHLAKCCHPTPPEEIIGYVTQNGGVGVHRTSCKNIINIHKNKDRSQKDIERANRLVKVFWTDNLTNSTYEVGLKIYASDRKYLLADILNAFSDEHVFVSKVESASQKDFTASINIVVEVKNQEQYDLLVGRVKGIRDVISVERR